MSPFVRRLGINSEVKKEQEDVTNLKSSKARCLNSKTKRFLEYTRVFHAHVVKKIRSHLMHFFCRDVSLQVYQLPSDSQWKKANERVYIDF